MQLARTLFARAVETPGGLKIDTIHAFCERLLHLVPFEANVPARFAVLDESQTDEMLAQATSNVMADAASGDFPELAEALDIVSVDAVGDALAAAIDAALKCKRFLHDPAGPARLRRELGLGPDETLAFVERAMLEGGLKPQDWPAIAQELLGRKGDRPETGRLPHRCRRGQGRRGQARKTTSRSSSRMAVRRARARPSSPRMSSESLKDALLREQDRVCALIDKRKAARAAERTGALFTLAAEIHTRVEQAKMRLGALDFQDLIDKTLALLSRGDTAWVLYKLDRGIDHVLIDEAQDTNPEQWEILRQITEDFTAGAGANGQRMRTLFAVGDPKQSIYGFQGAAPQQFETTAGAGRRRCARRSFISRTCR